ncbi:MAG: homoserine O-acetyltransferase, partial [Verrucomicrobiales bacterium]
MRQSVGNVETQFFTTGKPFRFADGAVLPSLTLAYESYGELNAARDNAILLFHALSGSHHAAGFNPSIPGSEDLWTEEMHEGWWDAFIGPGKALDTDRFFIICANYIGGCYGSTGPVSTNPETGKPYASSFPHITVADVVKSQLLLL